MSKIFVLLDTAALLALANRRDNLHEQAKKVATIFPENGELS